MNESIQMASRAAALSNNADAARWDLINALTAGNRHEEALEQIDIHIRHRPDDKEALIRKARILLDMGQARNAREVVQAALNSGADELSGGIVKAQALRMEGREPAGRRILIELTRKFPTSSWPLWELGRWAEEAGTLGKAKRYANQAVDRSPDDAGCRLLLGRILRKLGKYNEARKQLSIIVDSKQGGVGWVIDATHELSYIDSVTRK
jgi:tetratricopeptide (TPR) repeat protein